MYRFKKSAWNFEINCYNLSNMLHRIKYYYHIKILISWMKTYLLQITNEYSAKQILQAVSDVLEKIAI